MSKCETCKQTREEIVHNILSKFAKKKGLVKYEYSDGFYVFGNPNSQEMANKNMVEYKTFEELHDAELYSHY